MIDLIDQKFYSHTSTVYVDTDMPGGSRLSNIAAFLPSPPWSRHSLMDFCHLHIFFFECGLYTVVLDRKNGCDEKVPYSAFRM